MLPKDTGIQDKLEFVSIESLVPQSHLLRKIESAIDFSFIREKCSHLYCENNGRPAIDPVVLYKMIFIGYLYGIRSERQLVKDVEVNVAYRWFLGMGLTDKVIDHSTLSQNRRRRFNGSDVAREIFDEIVLLGIRHNLIKGETLFSDSTHLKANANKHKFTKEMVNQNTREYLDKLEQSINEDRLLHGKKPLKNTHKEDEPEQKEIKQSTTDPESGYMVRDGKPEGFFYLDHRTVDSEHNFITDVYVSPGNVYDSICYMSRLEYQTDKFGFEVKQVALDAGYNTADICHGLVEKNIFGVIGYRRPSGNGKGFYKKDYLYDADKDVYLCPLGCELKYRTTDRNGYRIFASDAKVCISCPFLLDCTTSKNCRKVITRHVWEGDKEQIKANRLSPEGKELYKRRKETIERSFADAKELHGYRYAKFRGLQKVMSQCLLTAACQNLKKMALIFDRKRQRELKEALFRLLEWISGAFYHQHKPIYAYGRLFLLII
jgi:transposase